MKVRVGIGVGSAAAAGLDAASFWTIIDDCEALGWDSVWLSERVTGNLPDPVAAMSAIAGRTRRLKFGPSVMVLPGRNPVLLAKQLATIDLLSGGRLVAAFGLGAAVAGEQQAFMVDRRERASWTDEAVPLMKRLWTEDQVTHEGRHFTVTDLTIRPRPVQLPHPDVWFGGHSDAATRRVGRIGDGWLPSFVTVAEYKAKARRIREVASRSGREVDEEHFGALVGYVPDGREADGAIAAVRARRSDADPADVVVTGSGDKLRARLESFIEQGASKFVILPMLPPSDWREELARLREMVVRPLEN